MDIPASQLEVATYEGEGYQPVVDFESWRAALLNYEDKLSPEGIRKMERHNETDEVFVLLSGQCILLIGDGSDSPGDIRLCDMRPGLLYNVKRLTWHKCALTPEARVLIVENRNTTSDNSDYVTLGEDQRSDMAARLREIYRG